METKQKERIRRLQALLQKSDRIHLKDAARMLEVSVMTIRRDLSPDNHPQGLPLTLLGGYIVAVNAPHPPTTHPRQNSPRHHQDDLPIAILAAGLIADGDVVFFDNGPEMPLVVSLIPEDIRFTGICCSHAVFLALRDKPQAAAILCGGSYRPQNDTFYDNANPSMLDTLNPRKVFISAAGVDERHGVTWHELDDAATKRRAITHGIRRLLLARSGLFDEVAPVNIAPLSAFDVLISDCALPGEYPSYCRAAGIQVITPDSNAESQLQ
ncbi:DeoR family transcriptional regulator [Edwardsiella piscicida]|uniref:DeoR family transcriptional regulator n=1 Tax=Edwardsiella piscicida TaxID=1263550 RepID=UPI002A5E0221|nr:DeoR family transcriptional regulator [Edwardsiella piscicida]